VSARDPFHEIKRIAFEIACVISMLGTCGTLIYLTISKAPYPVQIALIIALIFILVFLLIWTLTRNIKP
jgi:hypothetical protein